MTVPGNERLLSDPYVQWVRDRRVGLITNHSGVDSCLVSTVDRLHGAGACDLVALYGPEHGIGGDAADGEEVGGARDPHTGLPVHSLYGDTQKPAAAMLEGIEAMVFDIQDVGVRFYTYLYTMSLSMEACAENGIPFIVLDRPNPIGGERVAGNVLDPAFASFLGLYPIPIQHGMTVGELAGLFNVAFGIGAELHVVPMDGWRRPMFWDQTGLQWVAPSPNMPALDTAVVYPGTCFFEGTNLSEGRGTAKPFEQVGAPYVDGHRLATHLNGLQLAGALFRPVSFQPTTSKHAGHVCRGVQVHVVDRSRYDAVRTGFEMIAAVRRLCPGEFAWHVPAEGTYNFDRLAGSDAVRQAIDAGVPVVELLAAWATERRDFEATRSRHLLYT